MPADRAISIAPATEGLRSVSIRWSCWAVGLDHGNGKSSRMPIALPRELVRDAQDPPQRGRREGPGSAGRRRCRPAPGRRWRTSGAPRWRHPSVPPPRHAWRRSRGSGRRSGARRRTGSRSTPRRRPPGGTGSRGAAVPPSAGAPRARAPAAPSPARACRAARRWVEQPERAPLVAHERAEDAGDRQGLRVPRTAGGEERVARPGQERSMGDEPPPPEREDLERQRPHPQGHVQSSRSRGPWGAPADRARCPRRPTPPDRCWSSAAPGRPRPAAIRRSSMWLAKPS